MTLTVLGSGTSHGIPVLACSCPVCRSPDPRDARYRSGAWLRGPDDSSFLIDCSPEFRLQGLRAGIQRIDTVLITHSHADHIHGLDDLRPLCRQGALPLYGNGLAMAEVEDRFSYVFTSTQEGGGKPSFDLHAVDSPFRVGGTELVPVPVLHGSLPILGWRIGGIAWITDCSSIPESSYPLLEGLDALVLGGLKDRSHPTHFSFRQAVGAAARIGARRTWLTHLCHEHSHLEAEALARSYAEELGWRGEVGIAWDGLEISCP